MSGLEDLRRVCRVLAKLVRDEYPEGLSLAEIVERWTSYDRELIETVRRVEESLEGGDEFVASLMRPCRE